ncbi:hypothetical protein HDV05_001072, partial [Chytridiales sp. JEL 0842]
MLLVSLDGTAKGIAEIPTVGAPPRKLSQAALAMPSSTRSSASSIRKGAAFSTGKLANEGDQPVDLDIVGHNSGKPGSHRSSVSSERNAEKKLLGSARSLNLLNAILGLDPDAGAMGKPPSLRGSIKRNSATKVVDGVGVAHEGPTPRVSGSVQRRISGVGLGSKAGSSKNLVGGGPQETDRRQSQTLGNLLTIAKVQSEVDEKTPERSVEEPAKVESKESAEDAVANTIADFEKANEPLARAASISIRPTSVPQRPPTSTEDE